MFVDDPDAVEAAEGLVGRTLEQQWGRGDDVSTEELRIALKRYRSFFERLLSV